MEKLSQPADLTRKHDELDWDDEDFQPTELVLPPDIKNTSNPPTRHTQDRRGGQDDDDQDWLTPRCETEATGMVQDKKAGAKSHTEKVYLTKQFHRLSTPVSKKKSRCAICTRPIPDGSLALYCNEHAVNQGK